MTRHAALTGAVVTALALGVLPVAFASQGSPGSGTATRRSVSAAPARSGRPPSAVAATRPSPRPDPTRPPERREEQLRLACEGIERGPSIACKWSASQHPAFAGYVLWRGDGSQRQAVHRTRDRAATHHVDTEVRPGVTYVYVVQVVNEAGDVIGHGGPVRARVPDGPRQEQLRLGCAGTSTESGPAVACRWSQSQHPHFAAYRLMRGDGTQRTVVFRTEDRAHTRFLDTDVQAGADYVYVVQVLDANGDVIGSGGPVKAHAPDRPQVRPVPVGQPAPTRDAPAPTRDGRPAAVRDAPAR